MQDNWLLTFVNLILLVTLGVGLASLAFFTWSSVYLVTVVSHSMSPTLREGDRVVVWRAWPHQWLRRGQVVLVWPWTAVGENPWARGRTHKNFAPYIKRIIGLEGDALFTNLNDLNESDQDIVILEHDNLGKRVWNIPAGHMFVVGDNRSAGNDSLLWGPVPTRTVMGLAIVKLSNRGIGLIQPVNSHSVKEYGRSIDRANISQQEREDS